MISVYMMVFAMTVLGAMGAIFFKKAANDKSFMAIAIGGLLYFISALINIYVLKFLDYSVVLPLTSVTYVWTMLMSRCFFGECVNVKKTVGIALILIGTMFITN